MNLKVGQVYDSPSRESVVVLEVRDKDHPKGLGSEHDTSALAWPEYGLRGVRMAAKLGRDAATNLHPFDATILCGSQPHHGDEVWTLIPSRWYHVGVLSTGKIEISGPFNV